MAQHQLFFSIFRDIQRSLQYLSNIFQYFFQYFSMFATPEPVWRCWLHCSHYRELASLYIYMLLSLVRSSHGYYPTLHSLKLAGRILSQSENACFLSTYIYMLLVNIFCHWCALPADIPHYIHSNWQLLEYWANLKMLTTESLLTTSTMKGKVTIEK